MSSPTTAVMFILGVLGLSALFTWLWSHADGRLFTVVVAHAMVNAPITFWEQTSAGGHDERLMTAWYMLEGTYALAGLALVIVQWRWWTATEELMQHGGTATVFVEYTGPTDRPQQE